MAQTSNGNAFDGIVLAGKETRRAWSQQSPRSGIRPSAQLSPEQTTRFNQLTEEIRRASKDGSFPDRSLLRFLNRTKGKSYIECSQDEAQSRMDGLQWWLDHSPEGHALRRVAIYLLARLCNHSKRLPPSLFKSDVIIRNQEQTDYWGGFADVFEGQHLGKAVAVKRLRVRENREEFNKLLSKEALVWRQLHHRYVLRLIGLDNSTFSSVCMVSPWMFGGSLRSYMRTPHYRAERDCIRILFEVALGTGYLHANKVTHGDINDTNILMDEHGHVRLADFGLVVIGDITAGRPTTSRNNSGTAAWMAPERYSDARRAPPVDVYAFACLAYRMCTGNRPFHDFRNENGIRKAVVGGNRPSLNVSGPGVFMPPGIEDVITVCWAQDPALRPRMGDVIFAFGLGNEAGLRRRCIFSTRAKVERSRMKGNKLTFSKSETIAIYSAEGREWIGRNSSSIVGFIPSSALESSSLFTAKTTTEWNDTSEDMFRTLPFKKNEVLEILALDGASWFARNSRGCTGIVPAKYLDVASQIKRRVRSAIAAVALQSSHSGTATQYHALNFSAGESVNVWNVPISGGWCIAQNARGDIGVAWSPHLTIQGATGKRTSGTRKL